MVQGETMVKKSKIKGVSIKPILDCEQLKKEVFLLEHGFYDEDIVEYINKNLRHFFAEEEISYVSGVKLEINAENHHCILPVLNRDLAAPLNILQQIYSVFSAGFLHRIRMTWFKKKYLKEFRRKNVRNKSNR